MLKRFWGCCVVTQNYTINAIEGPAVAVTIVIGVVVVFFDVYIPFQLANFGDQRIIQYKHSNIAHTHHHIQKTA